MRWESVPALRQKTRHLNFIDISALLRTQEFALKSAGRVPVSSDERRFPLIALCLASQDGTGQPGLAVAWCCRSLANGLIALDPDSSWKDMKKAGRKLFQALG
jgi:hypothetical protein